MRYYPNIVAEMLYRHIWLLLVALFIACAQNPLHAQSVQWELQDSLVLTPVPGFPATASFSSIDCPDSLNCIATGAVGNVYSLLHTTTDGGKHWKTVILDSAEITPVVTAALRLRTIRFLTPTIALIIADSGAVMRSSDAGATWSRIETGSKNDFTELSVLDPGHIAVIGYSRTIVVSSDTGKTWSVIPSPTDSVTWGAISIAMTAPSSLALAMGSINNNGSLYLHDDTSKPWPAPQPFTAPARLFFLDKQHGWSVGREPFGQAQNTYDVIQKTNDGGKTWETVVRDSIYPAFGLITAKFLDEQHGTAVGFFGKVLLTNDGGKTWKPNNILKTNFLEFARPTKNHIWIATVFGQIFHGTISETSDARSENTRQTSITITPNPANKRAALHFDDEHTLHSISIVDALGKQWLAFSKEDVMASKGQILLNTENLPTGQYFVFIRTEESVRTLPLTIVQ